MVIYPYLNIYEYDLLAYFGKSQLAIAGNRSGGLDDTFPWNCSAGENFLACPISKNNRTLRDCRETGEAMDMDQYYLKI